MVSNPIGVLYLFQHSGPHGYLAHSNSTGRLNGSILALCPVINVETHGATMTRKARWKEEYSVALLLLATLIELKKLIMSVHSQTLLGIEDKGSRISFASVLIKTPIATSWQKDLIFFPNVSQQYE